MHKGGMMNKERATIVIDKSVWKEFKKLAIDKEMSVSKLLEMIVSEYVNNGRV